MRIFRNLKLLKISILLIFTFIILLGSFITVSAKDSNIVAEPMIKIEKSKELLIEPMYIPNDEVAIITIYADPTSSGIGSSGSDGGTHDFITIKNTSSSNITVGKLSGIEPNKTVSLGTWGNKAEHEGLWYNLESYFYATYGAYSNTVSVSRSLTAEDLDTVNSTIINNDSWSLLNNCSSFATEVWNSFSSTTLSAGFPNTPANLADSIESNFSNSYVSGASVPYDYVVYYAQGTGTPIRSTEY